MDNLKEIFYRNCFLLIVFSFFYISSFALVKYDEGRIIINGIQLLQDSDDESAYYYLPDYPRISIDENGEFELMCMKYIGQGNNTNGGLFHTLIQFDLPKEIVDSLEEELKKKVGNARIVGPVPLRQVMENGEDGLARFKIVSSILTNTEGENPFTQNVITSGHAPLLPNSKAAIAAKLSQEGVTLLWESLQGTTSDVSVVINGYYEAKVKGYNATVTANMSTIYEHYSKLYSYQKGYTKRQLRKINDEMIQDQKLKIEVFDRSKALGIKTDDMDNILNLITDKLIELMFDAEVGWAKQPEKETAVEQGQIKGRQKRGWFSRVFGGARDEKYVTDNQFVIKKREDIKVNKFYLNLSKSTTIKVPVFSSGNIGGLYQVFQEGNENKYFKVVNLEDIDFLKREIIFQIDGQYIETFNEILNSVSVSFKKTYGEDQNDLTRDVIIKRDDIKNGTDFKSVFYPRLGIKKADWLDYEYRISWNLKGEDKPIQIPFSQEKWLKTNEAAVVLNPPFTKKTVQIDADRTFFKDNGFQACTVRFFVILNGKPIPQKMIVLRSDDVENSSKINLYYDIDEPIIYQVNWYGNKQHQSNPTPLTSDYLFLMPPSE